MDIVEWKQDRDNAFAEADEQKIKDYCNKYKISIPEDEETFWLGVHKVICNLYLTEEAQISTEQYNKSFKWLAAHGSAPSID